MAITAAELVAKITVDGAEAAANKLESMAKSFAPAGPLVAGAAALGVALVGVGVASVKMAADYQQRMLMVQAETGTSKRQMDEFDTQIKKLAIDAGVAPAQLADGLYKVISAGIPASQAMNVLTLATEDAKIGMTDAATTSFALTAILTNFHVAAKDAARANGEMLETVTLGNMSMSQYASSIAKAAVAAANNGVSMEQMNATIATLTAHEIPAAQAVTDFTQVITLMGPHLDTLVKSLHKGGIEFDTTKFYAMDYSQKIQYLAQALQDANDKHIKISGTQKNAIQLLQILSQNTDMYNKDLATLSNRQQMAKQTQEEWATTQEGFNQQMSRLGAAVQVLMIDIGQHLLPQLTKLAALMTPLVVAFTAWTTSGKAASDIMGFFQRAIANVLTFLSPLFALLNVIWKFLVAAFTPAWQQVGDTVKSQLVPAWQQLIKALQPLMPEFELIGKLIIGIVIVALILLVSAIAGVVTAFARLLVGVVIAVGGVVKIVTGMVQIVSGVLAFFVDLFTGQFNLLGRDIATITGGWIQVFSGAWDVIKGIFIGAIGAIIGWVSGFVSTLGGLINTALSGIQSLQNAAGGVHLPGHASGITDSPTGHLATVGEEGPEVMWVPKGASIFPHGSSVSVGGGSSSSSGQPIILQIDGRTFARVVLPHLTDQIRYSVGTHAY